MLQVPEGWWTSVLSTVVTETAVFLILAVLTALWAALRAPWRRIAANAKSSVFFNPATGGACFYLTRAQQKRFLGDLTSYLKSTKSTLAYVGMQFYSLDHASAKGDIRALLDRGVKIQCYLVDPDEPVLVNALSAFLGQTPELFIEQTRRSIAQLQMLKHAAGDKGMNLEVFVHKTPIYNTCFLIDVDDNVEGRILVDHKLYGAERALSYGFELNRPKEAVFNCFKGSYLGIARDARRVEG